MEHRILFRCRQNQYPQDDTSSTQVYNYTTKQEEQLRYDFANPGYNCASRQFAANVWRSMTHVGFGVGNRVNGCYVVAAVFDGNITAVDSQAWLRNVWPARVVSVLKAIGNGEDL